MTLPERLGCGVGYCSHLNRYQYRYVEFRAAGRRDCGEVTTSGALTETRGLWGASLRHWTPGALTETRGLWGASLRHWTSGALTETRGRDGGGDLWGASLRPWTSGALTETIGRVGQCKLLPVDEPLLNAALFSSAVFIQEPVAGASGAAA
ncbi:unnamed protein product [Gadus morhua 'NCC']